MPANIAKSNLDDDRMIWGAVAIGAALDLTPRQAFHQLKSGRVPSAREVGPKWSASAAVLRQVRSGEVPPIDV